MIKQFVCAVRDQKENANIEKRYKLHKIKILESIIKGKIE